MMDRHEFEGVLRNVIKDQLRPINERLESIEINVGAAVSRLNAYVERQFDELKREMAALRQRVERLEIDRIPDTERPSAEQ